MRRDPRIFPGGADGIRTRDLVTASHARSQLRHSPRMSKERELFLDLTPSKVKRK